MDYANGTAFANDLIESYKKAVDEALFTISSSVGKDAQAQRNVPYLTGALSSSAMQTPYSDLKSGIVIWDTPYARRQYFENSKGEWDITTWDKNESKYIQMANKVFDEYLKK